MGLSGPDRLTDFQAAHSAYMRALKAKMEKLQGCVCYTRVGSAIFSGVLGPPTVGDMWHFEMAHLLYDPLGKSPKPPKRTGEAWETEQELINRLADEAAIDMAVMAEKMARASTVFRAYRGM